jgi:hypothetical protein
VFGEKPLAACGFRKFPLDAMGDHLCTCTAHSGVKKAHDWTVEELVDLLCLWFWISLSPTTVSEVALTLALTLVLTDTYITLMILINHLMRLPLIKYGNIALTIVTIHQAQSPFCMLFLVRLGGYIVNSLDCYSYKIIGKLTTFLQLQEFSLRNKTVDYSTSTSSRFGHPESKSRQHPCQG